MPAPLRFLPAILALAMLAPDAQAQRLTGGLRMGASVATLRSDGPLDLSPVTDLAGGLWLAMPLAGGFHFQPEVNYLSAGAKATARAEDVFGPGEAANPDLPVRLRFSTTYLQFPLLVAWEPPVQRTLTPRLFAGPYVAFKQNAYVRFGAEGEPMSASETDEAVEARDYGLTFGGQIGVDTGAFGRLAFGAEASAGLADLRAGGGRTTHLGVLLYVGLAF